jgi:hypothetical protein
MESLKAEQYGPIDQTVDPILVVKKRREFRRFMMPVAARIASNYTSRYDLPEFVKSGLTTLQTTRFVQAYNHLLRKQMRAC